MKAKQNQLKTQQNDLLNQFVQNNGLLPLNSKHKDQQQNQIPKFINKKTLTPKKIFQFQQNSDKQNNLTKSNNTLNSCPKLQKPENQSDLLFEGYQIIFLGPSVNLSQGRIKILNNQIQKNGGFIYTVQELISICQEELELFLENPKCLMMGSIDLPKRTMDKCIEELELNENHLAEKIIDCEWITKSLLKSQIQDLAPYKIDFNVILNKENMQEKILKTKKIQQQSQERKQQLQEEEPKVQKHIKKNEEQEEKNHQNQNYTRDSNQFYQRYHNQHKKQQNEQLEIKSNFSNLVKRSQHVQKKDLQYFLNLSQPKEDPENNLYDQQSESTTTENSKKNTPYQNQNKIVIKRNSNSSNGSSQFPLQQQQNQKKPIKSLVLTFSKDQTEEKQDDDQNSELFSGDEEDVDIHDIDEEDLQQQPQINSENIDIENYKIQCHFNHFFSNDKQQQQQQQQGKIKQNDMIKLNSSKFIEKNRFITDELERLKNYYRSMQDPGRTIAYKKAISAIHTVGKPIETEQDVELLPYIGHKLKCKVKEILKNGKLRFTQTIKHNEKFNTIHIFSNIWGVGPKLATQLFAEGHRTLQDLNQHSYLLNRVQQIGLKHYEEFQQKIPRSETEEIFQIVQKSIQTIESYQNQYTAIACGSFRRGAEKSGDIDILITQNSSTNKINKQFFPELIQHLENQEKLLTDHLQLPHTYREKVCDPDQEFNNNKNLQLQPQQKTFQVPKYFFSGQHSETYMGVCQLPGKIHRRIDIKIYPKEYFGFALMHFTGSKEFNASLRLFTRKNHGLILNDRGFFKLDSQGQKTNNEPIKVACPDEQSIFNYLGLDYKSPQQRNL